MKRILLAIVMMVMALTINAQSIIYDKVIDNSMRTIETTGVTARSFTDRVVWTFGMKAVNKTDNVADSAKYVLIINLNAMANLGLKDNGTLLIKTFNDDVIELHNIMSEHSSVTIGYSYRQPILGNIGTVSANNVHRNVAYFYINESDIAKLNSGVKKVRVETANGFTEKEYKKDKCGKYLYDSYKMIKDKFQNSSASDIHDGF